MSTKLLDKTASEAAERQIGKFDLLHEDEKTRITHWVIKPGEQTGWHLHDYDYVTVQQSTGICSSNMPTGRRARSTIPPASHGLFQRRSSTTP